MSNVKFGKSTQIIKVGDFVTYNGQSGTYNDIIGIVFENDDDCVRIAWSNGSCTNLDEYCKKFVGTIEVSS